MHTVIQAVLMTFSNNLAILNYHFTFQVYEKVFLAYTLAISLGTLLFSIPNTYAETNLQIFDAFKTATVSSTIFNVI